MTLLIAGVDEVGRGPLAGPVISAAVILPENCGIVGLADSKKLTEKKREALYDLIVEGAVSWSLGRAEVDEIDTLNIFHATMLSMMRAIDGLSHRPDEVLIDGNKIPEGLTIPAQAIVKGDQKERAISAASIIAKVTRDREMVLLHEQYPEYGFDKHKGYPTKVHREQLMAHGPTKIHRMSFSPVAQAAANKIA